MLLGMWPTFSLLLWLRLLLKLTWHSNVSGDVSSQLDDVRKVILVPAVVLATVRLKQVITWKKFENLSFD